MLSSLGTPSKIGISFSVEYEVDGQIMLRHFHKKNYKPWNIQQRNKKSRNIPRPRLSAPKPCRPTQWTKPTPKPKKQKEDFYYFSDQVDADSILDTTTNEQRQQWKKEKEENIKRYNLVEEEDSSSEEEYDPHGPSKWFILKDGVAPVDESELDEWADDEAF